MGLPDSDDRLAAVELDQWKITKNRLFLNNPAKTNLLKRRWRCLAELYQLENQIHVVTSRIVNRHRHKTLVGFH